MLDRDLAALYGVTTGNLNKAVQRNPERFPADFMFRLTTEEAGSLRFQFGSLKRGHRFKYLPYVFTQEGASMLSSVLRSLRAIWKTDLAGLVPKDELDPEVVAKLDTILAVARKARPSGGWPCP